MKKVFAILLLTSFLAGITLMPFYNFQDTDSAKILYSQFLQQDNDGDVFEFITNDILNLGSLFEDEDEPGSSAPQSQKQQPFHTIQIFPGSLSYSRPVVVEAKEPPVTTRVFCCFVAGNYKLHFSSFVFHPPAVMS